MKLVFKKYIIMVQRYISIKKNWHKKLQSMCTFFFDTFYDHFNILPLVRN